MKSLSIVAFWIFIIGLAINISFAQSSKDTMVTYYLEKAKLKIEEKKFSEANDLFKKIFSRKAVVPDELAYYYGYTQLNLSNYSKSRVALTKYISLQGEDGPLSKIALEALDEADCQETGYRNVTIECDICYGDSTIEQNCRNCKAKGIETCTLCKGSGVSKATGSFGSTSFQTCKRCNGAKIIKCTICKGDLKEKTICYNCNGKGRKKIRRKCNT